MKVWPCFLLLLLAPPVASVIRISNANQATITTSVVSCANTGGNDVDSKGVDLQLIPIPSRRDAHDRAVRISWSAQSAVRATDVKVAYVLYASRTSDIQVILRLPAAWEKPVVFEAGPDSFVLSTSARRTLQLQAQDIFRTIAARKISAGHPDQSATLTFVQRRQGRKDVALYRASVDFQTMANPSLLVKEVGESTFEPLMFDIAEFRRTLARSSWLHDGDVTTSVGVITNSNWTTTRP